MIICTLFWVLVILTLIGIFLVIKGLYDITRDRDVWLGIGTLIICLTFLFGWLLIGTVMVQETKTINITANVLKDSDAAYLSYKGNVIATYNDVASYSYFTNKTNVNMVGKYGLNMYKDITGTTNWSITGTSQLENKQ
jgi:hypothetical protein